MKFIPSTHKLFDFHSSFGCLFNQQSEYIYRAYVAFLSQRHTPYVYKYFMLIADCSRRFWKPYLRNIIKYKWSKCFDRKYKINKFIYVDWCSVQYTMYTKFKTRIWKMVNKFVCHFCWAFICLVLVIRVSRAHFIPFVNISRFIGQFEWYFEWAKSSRTIVSYAFQPTIHLEQFSYARLHFTVRNVHFFLTGRNHLILILSLSLLLCTFFSYLPHQTQFQFFTKPNSMFTSILLRALSTFYASCSRTICKYSHDIPLAQNEVHVNFAVNFIMKTKPKRKTEWQTWSQLVRLCFYGILCFIMLMIHTFFLLF